MADYQNLDSLRVKTKKFEKVEGCEEFELKGFHCADYIVRGHRKTLGTKDFVNFYLWGAIMMEHYKDPFCTLKKKYEAA